MDTSVAKDMIRVIRDERDKRERDFRATEEPDMGDLWPYMGEPFFNELCLALLVAIRGHFERELVLIAALVDGGELDDKQYRQRVEKERKNLKDRKNGWKNLIAKLRLDSIAEWDLSMKTLHLLSNSYKHNPETRPDKELLKHLGLDGNYAPLPESHNFKNGLASSLDLPERADYCDIADELVSRVDRFLAEVKARQLNLSRVRKTLADPTNPESYEG
jgi:hypothetical protein